ncbi:LamG-like jellyroll fold domain-containing protein [Dactylosporangium sp. CA-139066]|uniref:LamG-like jellyroll fold domain-containing protein n=1 Tax=Dactylosporangium sp. CA-139066 TaxID=3239930 RepID=UPI003D8DFF58
MSGRSVLPAVPMRKRRPRQLTRRLGVVVMAAMLLSIGVPSGVLPTGRGEGFPVSWLWDWLGQPASWAKDPKGPQQLFGKGPNSHYQAADRAKDSESKVHAKGELAKYKPNQPKAENVSTGPAKKGFDARTSKRVAAKSSERADVFQNADGTFTQRVFQDPINFKTGDGSWQPIDNNLRADAQGRPQAGANAFQLSFAAGVNRKLDADGQVLSASAAPINDDLVRINPTKGTELAYSLAGATPGKAAVDGQQATYSQVLPGVDLQLGARSYGAKETLVLRSADAPTSYVYPLRLKGLTPRIGAEGSVEFTDGAGAVVATMPLGYLEDAKTDRSGAGATSYDMRYELITVNGAPAVRMTIDGAWLRDPARQFPVRLDPQVKVYPNGDTYSLSTEAGTTHGSNDTVAAGRYDSGSTQNKARGFLRFQDFETLMSGVKLDSARLHLFMTYQVPGSSGQCTGHAYNVYRITGNWSQSSLTWNNQPGDDGVLVASASPSSSVACTNTAQIRNNGTWSAPWLDTAAMVDWGVHKNKYGLLIRADEGDNLSWKRFTSQDAGLNCNDSVFGSIPCAPWIEANYSDNTRPEMDAQYPANNTSVTTLTPEFSARGHDPDNWPGYALQYQFVVFDDQGNQVADSGLSANSVWTPNAGVLKWGKTYFYQARISDQQLVGPSNPVTYAFSTQVPQPLVTSSLAQNGGKGFEGSVGNYTTSDVDAQVATVGPALAINRDYNSLDTRAGNSFGQGWSSVTDMQVREIKDASGTLQTAAVRYPGGQEVSFGRNNDGSWAPPPGRYSVFKPITGGYSLTDKDSTTYEFTQNKGNGVYGITKVTDPSARSVTYHYDTNARIDVIQSVASQRKLNLTWITPTGAANAHVATVTTDRTDPAVTTSTLTWTYTYAGDKLTKVCPPGTTTDCATYDYQVVNQAPSSVLNTGPYSYWRFNEASGTTAQSGVLSNDGADNGTYSNVTLGGAPALPQSTATTASFNGTSSMVSVPTKLATESNYQSIAMWFKTGTPLGVLFSEQTGVVSPGATTPGGYNPVLYIGNDGKLRGEFWMGNPSTPITTTGTVTDNQWHHVALSGNGGSQKMYLDGALVGTLNGTIVLHNAGLNNLYIGAGFVGGAWPAHTYATATATFFNGSMADAAFYNKPLTDELVKALYTMGKNPTPAMSLVKSNAGRVRAQVTYDTVNGRVKTVTDEAGGIWQVGAPVVSGSSQGYVSSVLGARPREYFRLNDTSLPTRAYSQVRSVWNAAYNNVVYDTGQAGTSPFTDTYGAIFNGTSSYLQYDQSAAPTPSYGPNAIEMWFKLPANYASSSVLYSYQAVPVEAPNAGTTDHVPALYVGGDGFLRGQFWDGGLAPITSTVKVNDGNWHHVVLSADGPDGGTNGANEQDLYLDNKLVGKKSGAWMVPLFIPYSYIGAGATKGWPSSTSDVSYFKGNIAEFAFFEHGLNAAQVDSHYKSATGALASDAGAAPKLTPVSTVSVTDPGGKVSKRTFDLLNGSRLVSSTDTLGNTTTYGYDVGGYVSDVYDPLGQKTETAKDIRGNTVRTTTCNNLDSVLPCQDTVYAYWPDDTTAVLTPDGRNDQLVKIDAGAGSLDLGTDAITTFTYDGPAGNRTSVTSPRVPGFPNGRVTNLTYTTATTAAVGGGTTPPGLPFTVTSPGGAVQKTEYNANGDAVRVTDAAGLVTEYTYDGIGRVTQQKVNAPGYVNGLVTSYRYDQESMVETTEPTVTDAITGAQHQARTTDVQDADGNLLSRTASDVTGGDVSRVVTSDYNAYGQLVKSTDPTGAVMVYGYDAYGRQNQRVNCDSSPAPGTPCPAGDRLQTLDQTFDAEGRLLTSTLTGRDGTAVQETYNVYLPNGDLASTTDAMGWTTKYEYYDDGKVKKVSRTDGTKTTVLQENQYDFAGNIKHSTQNNGATSIDQLVDNDGRVQSTTTYTSGATNGGRTTNYVYDADSHVINVRNVADGQTLRDIRNTYDPAGRLTSTTTSPFTTATPAGWWKLDENAPANPNDFSPVVAADSSGSQRHAIGDVFSGNSISGGFATFSNNAGSFKTDGPVLNTTQSYTVSAWVKVPSFSGHQTVVGQGNAHVGAFYLQYHAGFNKWTFISPSNDASLPTSYAYATSSNALTPNTWANLVGVFDANTKRMSIYVNNVRGTDGTNPTPWAANGSLSIGGEDNADGSHNQFTGSIDNVQVYQRAFTDAEVASLWDNGNGRTNQKPLAATVSTTTYTVDQRGLTTDVKDPNGNTTSYVYDEDGNLTTTLAPSVSVEAYGQTAVSIRPTSKRGYNTFGETVEVQDPLGNVTTMRMDAAGRPWKTILPSYTQPGAGGATIADASTVTGFDKLGRVTTTTDPRGKTTSYKYDTLGNLTKTTDPAGKVSTATYDKTGNLLETVDPTGAKASATYDYLGRKLTSTQWVRVAGVAQPYVTNYDYGTGTYGNTAANGPWLQKVTSPDGVTAESTYNNVGEPVTTKDGAGNVTTTTYDGLGQAVQVLRPDNTRTSMIYDGAGRVTQKAERNASNVALTTQSATYDNNGNLATSTDPRGITTTLTYNALNQVTDVSEPVTATTAIHTSYGYDAAGHQTRFTDGRSNAFWNTYNTWGLPESQIEPATIAYPNATDRTFTAVYDAAGRMTAQLQPGGVRTDYDYDDLNRLTGQTGSGADAATVSRSFGYDDAGRLTSLSVPGGTNTITYDDRGLPLSISGPNDSTTYTYTHDGQVATRQDAAGTTTFTYDAAGRFKTLSNGWTNVDLTVNYNSMSLPSTIVYGINNQTRTFTYDDLHRITNDQIKQTNGSTILGNIAYGYDEDSNETSKTTTGFAGASINTYTYDLANRLTSWTSGSTVTNYEYDDSGNRTRNGSKTFTYDQRNQLQSSSDGTTYSYTPRGTLALTGGTPGVYATTADAFGQVITQQGAGGTSTNQYDAAGRAVRPGFKYSGLGNTLAQDSTATYTRGPAGDLIAIGAGDGAHSFYAWTDQHDDVVGEFKATGTSLAGSASYDPLGKVLATSSLAGSLGYQSEYTDAGTGRVNMLARWYNTDTGQFDTRDTRANSPIPDSIAANRYQYAGNNPLTNVDPSGHSWWDKVKSVGSTVVNVVTNPVQAIQDTYHYVSTKVEQAWNVAKDVGNWVADKAKKAAKVVYNSTSNWVKKKVNDVKDKYNQAKQCLQGGVSKCVKDTVKAAVKHVSDTIKNTVEAIKQDPWKFVITAAVGLAATVAVGALCATGVGCLIVAGAIAGAMQAGAGYMVDVARGDAEFSWSGLADTMIEGGLDGALSAGVSKFTGGATKFLTKPFKAAGAGAMNKMFGGRGGGGPKDINAPKHAREGGEGSSGRQRRESEESGGNREESSDSDGGRKERGGGACPAHSFAPDTLVLLADGTTKRIDQVAVGDKVMATDPETGASTAEDVEVLHRNHDTDLTKLTVKLDDDSEATLQTTWHHPFWDDTQETWVYAQDLPPGDALRTDDGESVRVESVSNTVGAAEMDDLTVGVVHTYYVVAGGRRVLVHNVGGSECGARTLLDRAKQLRLYQGTTAVVRVRSTIASADGTFAEETWVATSKRYQPGAWKNGGLKPGEVFKPRLRTENTHAEEDILDHLGSQWEIVEGASNVNICKLRCLPELAKRAIVGGQNFRTSKPNDHSPWRLFWNE